MKTFQTLGKSILIVGAVLLSACNKDDNNPVPTPSAPSSSFITAKIDGANFSSMIMGTSTATCNRIGTGTDAMITILAADMSANSVTVYLHGIATPGTYAVNSETNSFLNYSPGSGSAAYSTGDCPTASGTITVTASDNAHIEGTFSFTGKDTDNCGASKTITEGSFKGIY